MFVKCPTKFSINNLYDFNISLTDVIYSEIDDDEVQEEEPKGDKLKVYGKKSMYVLLAIY